MHKIAKLASEVWRVAHSSIPVSYNGLGDKSSEVVWILPADTLHSDGNVSSRDGIVSHTDLRPDKVGPGTTGSTNV